MKNNICQINWSEDWDPAVGLWSQPKGHTRTVSGRSPVHAGPTAANRLLVAAHLGQLDQVDAASILDRLRQMQVVDQSELHGCFRWYWEETELIDTNAAFFTGLPLILLWQLHRDRLPKLLQPQLKTMLGDLRAWFRRAANEKAYFYPNKFLGDLVCGWLLLEIDDRRKDDAELAGIMEEAARYWRNHGWGWGEHMSDGYAAVCLDEVSALLLLSKRLPQSLRAQYHELFQQLLSIEDWFDGGPRVPALRSYVFRTLPHHENYRDTICAFPSQMDIRQLTNRLFASPIFHELGWHQLAPPRQVPPVDLEIPCFGGIVAKAHLRPALRIGSFSRFPIMPVHEYPNYGLAWQTMPVALWRKAGTWAYLQWATREENRLRCHPGEDMSRDCLGNALSAVMMPPPVGRTFALQRAGNVVALRIMPVLSMAWERLSDRFRIVGAAGNPLLMTSQEGWFQLKLPFPDGDIFIQCMPLTERHAASQIRYDGRTSEQATTFKPVIPVLSSEGDNVTDWSLDFEHGRLTNKRMVLALWGISVDGPVTTSPTVRAVVPEPRSPRSDEETVWQIEWPWPTTSWRFQIDPLASAPLSETNA